LFADPIPLVGKTRMAATLAGGRHQLE